MDTPSLFLLLVVEELGAELLLLGFPPPVAPVAPVAAAAEAEEMTVEQLEAMDGDLTTVAFPPKSQAYDCFFFSR
jgi:hypothetical protein